MKHKKLTKVFIIIFLMFFVVSIPIRSAKAFEPVTASLVYIVAKALIVAGITYYSVGAVKALAEMFVDQYPAISLHYKETIVPGFGRIVTLSQDFWQKIKDFVNENFIAGENVVTAEVLHDSYNDGIQYTSLTFTGDGGIYSIEDDGYSEVWVGGQRKYRVFARVYTPDSPNGTRVMSREVFPSYGTDQYFIFYEVNGTIYVHALVGTSNVGHSGILLTIPNGEFINGTEYIEETIYGQPGIVGDADYDWYNTYTRTKSFVMPENVAESDYNDLLNKSAVDVVNENIPTDVVIDIGLDFKVKTLSDDVIVLEWNKIEDVVEWRVTTYADGVPVATDVVYDNFYYPPLPLPVADEISWKLTGVDRLGNIVVEGDLVYTPGLVDVTTPSGILGWLNSILRSLQDILAGVKAIPTAIARFFDLTQPVDLEPLRISGEMVTTRFPFSLPFDLINSFKAFESNSFNGIIPINIDAGIFKINTNIDLSFFDAIRDVVLTFELILFDIGLIFATSKLFGGAS